MGADVVATTVVSAFWAVVIFILPFVFGRGPNKGVIQTVLVISGFSCWLFWFLAYVHQMNPLIGPQLSADNIYAIKYLWENDDSFLNYNDTTPTEEPMLTTPSILESTLSTVDSTAAP